MDKVLIKTWEELSNIKSDTHVVNIDVEMCNGWIHTKDKSKMFEDSHYLSTHTFYGENYESSTTILQRCGFNVEIANWDKEV